ncbi:MAG: dihydroorotase [Candidatus Omnitrophota bacterium]
MKLLIKNGRVVDPANNIDEIRDVLVDGLKISKVAKDINEKVEKIIDATGKIVMPGIVDMHVHLREPGREDKETICTGTKAALKGGVTTVLAMPNTQPAMDCVGSVKLLKDIIKRSAVANVFIAGSITKGRLGRELVDIDKVRKEGVVAITDDGNSVDDEKIFLKALKEAKKNKVLVVCHCEDKALSKNGVVNLGIISTRLGLRGVSKEAEYKRVERDIGLAEKAYAPIHIAHVSAKESVELIAKAKKKGIKVSAETAPHYFYYSQDALSGYDTNLKVNPPLRTKDDVDALKQGLRDGTIDCIASDHAPHTENEKMVEFDRAEFGTIGLETELAVSNLELVGRGLLTWPQLVKKLCVKPAKILNIDKGMLSKGKDADIIIVSPEKEWVVDKSSILSKSKNSCFLGKKLKGMVEYTILAGKIVYKCTNSS